MLAYNLILYGTLFLIAYAYRPVFLLTKELKTRPKWVWRILFLATSLFIYGCTAFFATHREEYKDVQWVWDFTIVGAITLAVTLLSICILQFIADLTLLGKRAVKGPAERDENGNKISRGTFLNKVALGVGAIMLGSFLWGTTKGIYGWRILKNQLSFDNLPKAFDGMKIVQISDLHLGSFNKKFGPLEEAVEMINELEPDYIVFTGDLVNESPDEAEPWINVFSKLKAKKGKFSVLGNHDYGWGTTSEEDKVKNSIGVAEINRKMGFQVMLNEHTILEHEGEKIGLVGVENWGYSEKNWFPTKGDYKASVKGMEDVPFKILLSHDPTHWDHHILEKENVDLTLAGHTHGGQMGISIPGLLEISAAKLFYDRYAGLYSKGKQHLYVNRGMGFLIFPGRVGMPPEITLHELNRA
ncbi:MAG: putative MPP superfamily phosphohydrolase [Bacteroidia bacterium]|jgi:predicted MPP superfamily phosphohydrolase